jgi:hypothetical protein
VGAREAQHCDTPSPAEFQLEHDAIRAHSSGCVSRQATAGVSPLHRRMRFCPALSTKVSQPLDTGVTCTRLQSIPSAEMDQRPDDRRRPAPPSTPRPRSRAATAWFAPFPRRQMELRPVVSPGRGNWSVRVVRSMFALRPQQYEAACSLLSSLPVAHALVRAVSNTSRIFAGGRCVGAHETTSPDSDILRSSLRLLVIPREA